MKNTPENKAKFFAQYWGQEVLMAKTNSGEFSRYKARDTEMHEHYFHHDCYLELTPLSQITDEDFKKFFHKINKSEPHGQIQIDYFRSKEYAVDWLDVSVEQQIEWGWVKLVEPNNK